MSLIPVTLLTGFLGSGKTTLLNRILKGQHGHRIAVIENEFGEAGIDNELLVQDRDEQIVEMNNGCICCTVRGDLVRILGELHAKKSAGQLHFDRVIIETTGLADPAPVAQTFFVDDDISQQYLLDAVVTMVDARHAPQQLAEHHEAQDQVGFADRILITKTDLVAADEVASLRQRLVQMNPRAKVGEARHGVAAIDDLLDIRGIDQRIVFQGVHMLMGSDGGAAWKPGEKRDSKMVFIGRHMPKDLLLDGLAQCVAGSKVRPAAPA